MEDSMPLISVIVPIYNVGEFLVPCLESLTAQTYKNLEILLIDDGSTDSSAEQCDKYAAKDSRIKVIHKKNGGVSSARNLGLDLAKGEYIAFVDADDLLKPDYFDVLYYAVSEQGAEIVFCNAEVVDEQGKLLYSMQSIKKNESNIDLETMLHQFTIGEGAQYSHVWGNLIKSCLAKQYRFCEIKYGEDTLYMFELLFSRPKIYLMNYEGYIYVRRRTSVTMSAKKTDLWIDLSLLTAYHRIYVNLPPISFDDSRYFLNYCAHCFHNAAYTAAQYENSNEYLNARSILKECLHSLLSRKKELPQKTRFNILLYAKAPWLYNILARLHRIIRG